jgi:hypothetical protein
MYARVFVVNTLVAIPAPICDGLPTAHPQGCALRKLY